MDSALIASSKPKWRRRTWLDFPQQSPLRKLILQIHLWTGLISGLYLILLSVTGSAVVMRREFNQWWSPPRYVEAVGARLSEQDLRNLIASQYPDHEIVNVAAPKNESLPISVTLTRDAKRIERRFDPYTGTDLGDPFPSSLRLVEWLVDLHDHLLIGETGRTINGIGGAALLVITLTGAVLWWPGRRTWVRSLYVSPWDTGRRFLFRLHSMLGFWTLALLLIWAATAIYFAFPEPFESLIDALDADHQDLVRPGEEFLQLLIRGHFGRFGGFGIRFTWITLGLVPIVLLVTGFLLWWRRRLPRGARST